MRHGSHNRVLRTLIEFPRDLCCRQYAVSLMENDPMRSLKAIAAVSVVVLATVAAGADELKSGPQVGKRPDNFFFNIIAGPDAGRTYGHYWRFRRRPVVCIFTRSLSAELTSLVKQIDDSVAKSQMSVLVVYLTDDRAKAQADLKALAEKHQILNTRLTLADTVMGPKNDYEIPPEAEVTVLMWRKREVRANHAFAEGKLDKAAISNIVADTQIILSD